MFLIYTYRVLKYYSYDKPYCYFILHYEGVPILRQRRLSSKGILYDQIKFCQQVSLW